MIARQNRNKTVVSVAALLTPIDCVEIAYSPSLLLPFPFHVSLSPYADYVAGCETGFDAYFECMYQRDPQNQGLLVFVNRFYSWGEVSQKMISWVTDEEAPLEWSAGFSLGFLSALALTDRPLALAGLNLLSQLVSSLDKTGAYVV